MKLYFSLNVNANRQFSTAVAEIMVIRTANTGHATKQHSLVRSFLD